MAGAVPGSYSAGLASSSGGLALFPTHSHSVAGGGLDHPCGTLAWGVHFSLLPSSRLPMGLLLVSSFGDLHKSRSLRQDLK